MQNTQAFIYKAKQKSNENHLFFYLSAESDEDAEVERDYLFMKAKYNKSDFFSPIRIDFPVVDDLPLERTFSETFLLSWALEGKAGKTCVPRNTLDVSIAFPELYPYMTKSEQQSNEAVVTQDLGINKSIESSSSNESDQPSHSQEPRAYFAKMSQDTRGVAVLMHGFDVIDTVLTKGQMGEVITISLDKENHYYSTMLDALRLPAVSIKGPEQFAAFVAGVGRRFEPGDENVTLVNVRNYVEQLLAERELPSTDASEPQEISYETLSMHTMLSIMNVHPSEAKPSDVRNAKEMMEQRDPIWRGLDKTFRVIVGIRNVDADTRHAIISEGLKNLKMLSDDGERLHFVKSYLAGHPACPELADYGQDTTAIDEGENESERLAWICNITQKALLGETDVMSKSDIAELMVSVGEDLSPKYMSRFLSKEIDVCDPFKQLTEEDIPHLICDVLENWCNEKEPRIAFINERVEFYLKDKRNAASVLFENSKLAEIDGSVSTDLPNDADLSTEQAVSGVVNPGAETTTEVTTTDVATTASTEPVVSTKPYFEPGRYQDISNEVYHSANGISSTMLKESLISLAYYRARRDGIIVRQQTDAFTLGSLVHLLALEPEKFEDEFAIKPEIPANAFTTTDSLKEFIRAYNEGKAKADQLKLTGKKEDLQESVRSVNPDAIFADELLSEWRASVMNKILITDEQYLMAQNMRRVLVDHPLAGPLLQHPQRTAEVSYFDIDEETGLDVRVRPDLEIDTGVRRIAIDLKTVSLPYVKQDSLRYRLHREIIERDYHMSAGMYCDVGMFDQFFWIFVNKEPGYHWVAVVEASADELALGRAIYKQQLSAIRGAMDTGIWPEPITEVFTDTLTEYELSRLKEMME